MDNEREHKDIMELRKAALRYLQTYLHLIQHESDLRIAQHPALCLVQKEVTWTQFCNFLADLNSFTYNDVSGRYHCSKALQTQEHLKVLK